MNKRIQKQIEKKLDQLTELLDRIIEVQIIDANDPDTWDSDTLYSLAEDLKAAVALLEDKTTRDEFGELTEPGLCSLMDDWESNREEEEND